MVRGKRGVAALFFLLVPLLGALAGCESGGGFSMPAPEEIYGMWANEDAGTTRVFHFAETLPDADLQGMETVYRVYVYPTGAEPVLVQRGRYDIRYGRLVTTVVWAINAGEIGRDYGNDVLDFGGGELVLESTSSESGRRTFRKVTELP